MKSLTTWSTIAVLLAFCMAIPVRGQCTKDIECKGDRICVDGNCVPGDVRSPQQTKVRNTGLLASFKLGPVFGSGGTAVNIDEGVELQFSGGSKFLWGVELNFHPISFGWGFGAQTGPSFNLTGEGTNGLLLQVYPGYKAEIITGLNRYGDFLVSMIECDANLVYQHVFTKGFLIGGGAGMCLLIIPDAGPHLENASGAAFGFHAVFHIGGAF